MSPLINRSGQSVDTRAETLRFMDAVLASVITSGVAVITTGVVTITNTRWTTRQNEKLAREQRTQQRLAESYLEVLRIVEREGQWVEAGIRITNWETAAEDAGFVVDPGDKGCVPGFKQIKPPELTSTDKAIISGHLAVFGSDDVRRFYQSWRSTIAAIGTEIVVLRSITDEYPDGPDHDQVGRLRDELYPTERAARQALADAIAEELGHR
jgi:hypothetical protein